MSAANVSASAVPSTSSSTSATATANSSTPSAANVSAKSSASSSSSVLEKRTLQDLYEYQKDIKKNLKNVEKKIFALEQSYLDETPGGNVIRGWDPESKPLKKGVEPKERLFSNSSHNVFLDYKPIQDELAIEAKIIAANTKATKVSQQGGGVVAEPKKKKKRKVRKEIKPVKAAVTVAVANDNEWVPDF